MSIFRNLLKIEKRDGDTQAASNTAVDGVGLSFLNTKASKIDSISLSAVFAAIDIISNSVAEIPIDVKINKENKETVVQDHPETQQEGQHHLYTVLGSQSLSTTMRTQESCITSVQR